MQSWKLLEANELEKLEQVAAKLLLKNAAMK
jgi:hypothetical protein